MEKNYFSLKQSNLMLFLFLASIMFCETLLSIFLFINPQSVFSYMTELSIALELAGYFALIAIILLMRVNLKTGLMLNGFNLKKFMLMLIACVLTYIAVSVCSIIFSTLLSMLGGDISLPPGMEEFFNSPEWFILLAICVIAPVFEELLFRGVILSGYARKFGPLKAAVFTGLLFAGIHSFLPSVVPLIIGGIMFGIVAVYTRSLYLSVIMHSLYNFLVYSETIEKYIITPVERALPVNVADGGIFVLTVLLLAISAVGLLLIIRALKKTYDKEQSLNEGITPATDLEVILPSNKQNGEVFFILSLIIMGLSILGSAVSIFVGFM